MYARLDQTRRRMGRVYDALGLGPIETPARVVLQQSVATLKAFGAAGAGPVALIVPAPIKRAYIWDLAPAVSVVQRLLRANMQVYLIQWERPEEADQGLGLADYADRLILACLDAIAVETGRREVVLAGHSLGGLQAAIFAALHPARVAGLVLLEAPLRFGPASGAFRPMLDTAPPAPQITALFGNVPGSFLNAVSFWAAPATFGLERWSDRLLSLASPAAGQMHLRVERWTFDEMPLARRLFEEVVDRLYREDRFMQGTLEVAGRCAAADQVTAPILSVADVRSRIIPPESIVPFHAASGSRDTCLLWYAGDVGVAIQHVGVLVGPTAHRELWPQIVEWMHARSAAE